ncbi:MAG: LysM peptidoglycan-binding domain-containing protein [Acidobacteriota bacterium]
MRQSLGTLLAALLCVSPLVAAEGTAAPTETALRPAGHALRTLDNHEFPVPPALRHNVAFWTIVYTRYESDTVLVHDDRHLQVIYAALDFSQLEESGVSERRKRTIRRDQIRKTKAKYSEILDALAAGTRSAWPQDQERVAALFDSVDGGASKYRNAKNRLRTQTCLADRFADGIRRSGLYMPSIERIFRAYDLPLELTRLPFVESLFHEGARSKAAAGGIWQFMPSTARTYMSIRAEADERFDPLRATDAAAQLLRDNHAALGTWPLAITAYNHGRGGMKRAVRQVGTRDIGTISQRYRSRTFGFASRNFYSEFIAAAEVYLNRDHYFPGVEPSGPLTYEEFVPEDYVSVPALAEAAQIDLDAIRLLNLGLSSEIWRAGLYLPEGYLLRVPRGTLDAVQTAYADLDDRSSRQVGMNYRVRPGDTLGRIARRYGTSVRALQNANGLRSANRIRVGQSLRIPGGGGGTPSVRRTSSSGPAVYVVQRGDTLSRVAQRFGTSVAAIQRANGLRNADALRVGQELQIPGAASTTHTVRTGETLGSIARRYGTSVAAIQRANRITSHIIRPSQVLIIPSP